MGYNKVILLECKDTSFGQNDFINLNAKAQETKADVVGIITTQPLHENVKRLLERTNKQSRLNIFYSENTDNREKIEAAVKNQMDSVRDTYIQKLFNPTLYDSFFTQIYRSFQAGMS